MVQVSWLTGYWVLRTKGQGSPKSAMCLVSTVCSNISMVTAKGGVSANSTTVCLREQVRDNVHPGPTSTGNNPAFTYASAENCRQGSRQQVGKKPQKENVYRLPPTKGKAVGRMTKQCQSQIFYEGQQTVEDKPCAERLVTATSDENLEMGTAKC